MNTFSVFVSVSREMIVAKSAVKTNTTADDWRWVMLAMYSTKTGIRRTEMAIQTTMMFAATAIRR